MKKEKCIKYFLIFCMNRHLTSGGIKKNKISIKEVHRFFKLHSATHIFYYLCYTDKSDY